MSNGTEMEARSPHADAALAADVAASASGSADAYRRLVDRSRNLVCSIALAAVRDLAESEEIAQEVYLSAWKALPALRNPASFLPWLRQLTRNECADHLKRRKRARLVQGAQADALLAAAVDGAPSAEQAVERREQLQALAEALEALPDDARETLVLFYREGHSVAQVALLLGLTPEAVKQRLSRARAQLQQSLWDRVGGAAADSAPGAAFSLAVVALLGVGASSTARAASSGVAKSPLWAGVRAAKLVLWISAPALVVAGALGANWFSPAASSTVPGPSAKSDSANRDSPATAKPVTAAAEGASSASTTERSTTGVATPDAPSTGRISKDGIRAAIQAVTPQVKACYEAALGKDPSLAGKVTLQLRLEAGDGGARVTEGEVVDSETRSPFFEACILSKVAGAAFPSPEEGAVTVRYPFTFDPGGGFGGTTPP